MPKKCMKSFFIEVEEILTRKVAVVAEDYPTALSMVKDDYDNESIVLGSDDFVEVNFKHVSADYILLQEF